jgi:hypothetical protein
VRINTKEVSNMGYKVTISGGREFNKPALPEYIKAGKTMRRLHKGGAKKASK